MALEGLPRGGGNGDDIRMGILHIMRANGIKEGHRPVGACHTFPRFIFCVSDVSRAIEDGLAGAHSMLL